MIKKRCRKNTGQENIHPLESDEPGAKNITLSREFTDKLAQILFNEK